MNIDKYKFKISPRKNINNIRKASEKFINNFDDINTKNLLFSGNTGLGKSYMSNCIANEFPPIKWQSFIDILFTEALKYK